MNGCGGDERLEMKVKDVKVSDLVKDGIITNDKRLDLIACIFTINHTNRQEADKWTNEKLSSVLEKSKGYKEEIFNNHSRITDKELFLMYRSAQEIDDTVVVSLLSGRRIDRFDWEIKVKVVNKSNEIINLIKGTYYIQNKFGDDLGTFKIRFDTKIPPLDSISGESSDSYVSPNDKTRKELRNGLDSKNFEDLFHYFWPDRLEFVSGRFLERFEPKRQ
jgi:hypothetical protein